MIVALAEEPATRRVRVSLTHHFRHRLRQRAGIQNGDAQEHANTVIRRGQRLHFDSGACPYRGRLPATYYLYRELVYVFGRDRGGHLVGITVLFPPWRRSRKGRGIV